jgi:hypothetical protein
VPVVVEEVDRKTDDCVVGDVETVVFRVVEELFDARLVDELVVVVVTTLMQEQALRIFEGSALQAELIGTGVAIAVSVVYTLQNEDATAASARSAFRQLLLLQFAETFSARNEMTQKRMVCMAEPRVADVKDMVAKSEPRKPNGRKDWLDEEENNEAKGKKRQAGRRRKQ